jgi:2-dehydropantoate 2-reductase
MKIAVLGAGALGCYYGARLAEAGHEVHLIMRSDFEAVKKGGLHITSIHGDINIDHPIVAKQAADVGPVDLVIVAWKAISNDLFATTLPPLIAPSTRVVTLQNGMGNAEAISSVVSPDRIWVGLCFICAMRTAPGQISHLEGDNIQFAPFVPSPEGSKGAQELAEIFSHAGIDTKVFDDAEKIQWFKLVWNIPFNGLCLAKGGISIGELYKSPDEVERARRIMTEVVASAEARGYHMPPTLVDFHMKRTESMSGFTPSSAVDFNLGRPIEYQAIWGVPISKARLAGASIPEWERLDREIRARLGMPESESL